MIREKLTSMLFNLPTLLFIPQKGQPQASVGVLTKESLIKTINDVLLIK
jgi:hypothetical protein